MGSRFIYMISIYYTHNLTKIHPHKKLIQQNSKPWIYETKRPHDPGSKDKTLIPFVKMGVEAREQTVPWGRESFLSRFYFEWIWMVVLFSNQQNVAGDVEEILFLKWLFTDNYLRIYIIRVPVGCLFVCLFVCLFFFLFVRFLVCLFVCCLFVCLFVWLFVCLFVCLFFDLMYFVELQLFTCFLFFTDYRDQTLLISVVGCYVCLIDLRIHSCIHILSCVWVVIYNSALQINIIYHTSSKRSFSPWTSKRLLKRYHFGPQNLYLKQLKHQTSGGMTGCLG